MDLVEQARLIATRAHHGKFRRDQKTPYLEHPAAVAAKLAAAGEPATAVAVGWLHDVIEDTAETPETLLHAGLPDDVVRAVTVLTRTDRVSYTEYLQAVNHNEIARRVKITDMLHNLSDAPTQRQILKYAKGLVYLLGG